MAGTSSPLLNLPGEIRHKIWEFVFTNGRAVYDDRAPFVTHATQSNREFYHESFPKHKEHPWGENPDDALLQEIAMRYDGYEYMRDPVRKQELGVDERHEIRRAIRQELFRRQQKNWKLSVHGGLDPGVLRTCHQVYLETKALYQNQKVELAILTHDFRLHENRSRPAQPWIWLELPQALNSMVTVIEHNCLTILPSIWMNRSHLPNLQQIRLRGKVCVLNEEQPRALDIESVKELARRTWQPASRSFELNSSEDGEEDEDAQRYSGRFYESNVFEYFGTDMGGVTVDRCATCWIIVPHESTYIGREVRIDAKDTTSVQVREATFCKVPFVKSKNGIPKHGWGDDSDIGDWTHVEKVWSESIDGWKINLVDDGADDDLIDMTEELVARARRPNRYNNTVQPT